MKKITKYSVSRKMYEEAAKELVETLPFDTNVTNFIEALRIRLFYRVV